MSSNIILIAKIPTYIKKQTGVDVTYKDVRRWIQRGLIRCFPIPRYGSKRFTTKRRVDDFIKAHSTKQGLRADLHDTYKSYFNPPFGRRKFE